MCWLVPSHNALCSARGFALVVVHHLLDLEVAWILRYTVNGSDPCHMNPHHILWTLCTGAFGNHASNNQNITLLFFTISQRFATVLPRNNGHLTSGCILSHKSDTSLTLHLDHALMQTYYGTYAPFGHDYSYLRAHCNAQGCQTLGHAGSQIPYKMRPNFTKRGQTSNFS